MKRKKQFIRISLIVALIAGVSLTAYLFRPSPKCVCNKKSVAILSVNELIELYEHNEDKADSLYLGKIISVKGIISAIAFDNTGRTIISFEGESIGTVSCTLGEKEANEIHLKKGNSVQIKGLCTGYAFDVILVKCCLDN